MADLTYYHQEHTQEPLSLRHVIILSELGSPVIAVTLFSNTVLIFIIYMECTILEEMAASKAWLSYMFFD